MTTTLTRCARIADVPAELAAAFRSMPNYMNDNDARDSYGEGTKWDPLSTEGGNRTPLYLTGWREAGRTAGGAVIYVLRFAASSSFGTRTVYAAYHLNGVMSVGDSMPTTRTHAEDTAQVYLNRAEAKEAEQAAEGERNAARYREKAAAAHAAMIAVGQRKLDEAGPVGTVGKTVASVETKQAMVETGHHERQVVTYTSIVFTDGTRYTTGDAGGDTGHEHLGDVLAEAECSTCTIGIYLVDKGEGDGPEWVDCFDNDLCEHSFPYSAGAVTDTQHTPAEGTEKKAA